MPLRRLEARLKRLEARYGTPEDLPARAMNEAVKRADYAVICLLFEAVERLGLEGSIEVETLRPLLDEDEAAALDALAELCDEVLEEWRLDG